MTVAFILYGHDDDSYMLGKSTYRPPEAERYLYHDWRFGKDGVPHPATCPTCGRKVDRNFVSAAFKVKKRRRDITATYDGYALVSQRFFDLCNENEWGSGQFVPLPADRKFYWLKPSRLLEFEGKRSAQCPTCLGFCSLTRPAPVFLDRLSSPLLEGFYRSDLEFGSGPEQSFVIVASYSLGLKLRAAKLVGLDLEALPRGSSKAI